MIEDAEADSTIPPGVEKPKSSMLVLAGTGGAGDEGRELRLMTLGGLLFDLISDDVRVRTGVTGLFTSSTAPPEVTRGRSCGASRQNDHLLPEVSGTRGEDSGIGASGSPSFDRVNQGDSCSSVWVRLGFRASVVDMRDVEGAGLGRERA